MFDTLFDPPWWLPAGLLAVAAYLFWSGNRRQDSTLRSAGLVGLLLGLLVIGTAYFVDTPTESAVKKTKAFVRAVDGRDWPTFDALLDAKTNVLIYRGKAQISAGIQKSVDLIGLKKVNLLGTEARRAQSLITVDINCLSEQDIQPYPTPTNWRFSWQFDGNAWYLARVEYLPRENLPNDAITNRLARP